MPTSPPKTSGAGPGFSSVLAVMARYPELGQVKTRLAATVGAEVACRLYRAFLEDIAERFAGGPRRLVWLVVPDECDFQAIVGAGHEVFPQGPGGLGERMHRAFRRLCNNSDPVLMIGADVPHVPDEWLARAERALADADLVLGPAEDGGYYLIGMRVVRDVFSGVPMGTSRVLTETIAAARRLDLTVSLLPELFDIDREADVHRLAGVLADRPAVELAATRRVIREEITVQ